MIVIETPVSDKAIATNVTTVSILSSPLNSITFIAKVQNCYVFKVNTLKLSFWTLMAP